MAYIINVKDCKTYVIIRIHYVKVDYMKMIQLLKLDDPEGYLYAMKHIHTKLLTFAMNTNDLRQYAISSLMLMQIGTSMDMLERSRRGKQYYCYSCDPFIYWIEDSDTIVDIMYYRDQYVYNSACG